MENILILVMILGGGVMLFSKKARAAFTEFGNVSPQSAIKTIDRSYDLDVLARTIWGEARGEGELGMQAVANVIMNRFNQAQNSVAKARQFGSTVAEVCLQPYQFSVWNITDPNSIKARAVTLDNEQFKKALFIAERALFFNLADITGGADHYHTTAVSPYWSEGEEPTAQIGNHLFFNV